MNCLYKITQGEKIRQVVKLKTNKQNTEKQRAAFKISIIPSFVQSRLEGHHLLYIILIASLYSTVFLIG